jgi:hypothetical protein
MEHREKQLTTGREQQTTEATKNSKSQISNNKQITMTEIPNLFWSLYIGICNLFVIWCLGFEI